MFSRARFSPEINIDPRRFGPGRRRRLHRLRPAGRTGRLPAGPARAPARDHPRRPGRPGVAVRRAAGKPGQRRRLRLERPQRLLRRRLRRGRLEIDRRRHDWEPDLRRPDLAVDRLPGHRPLGFEPGLGGNGRGLHPLQRPHRRRHLQVDGRRPDLDADGAREERPHRPDRRRPPRPEHRLRRGPRATATARRRSAASTGPRTAARPGSRSCSSTRTPAASGLAIDPNNPADHVRRDVVRSSSRPGASSAAGPGGGVFVSRDGGDTWTTAPGPGPARVRGGQGRRGHRPLEFEPRLRPDRNGRPRLALAVGRRRPQLERSSATTAGSTSGRTITPGCASPPTTRTRSTSPATACTSPTTAAIRSKTSAAAATATTCGPIPRNPEADDDRPRRRDQHDHDPRPAVAAGSSCPSARCTTSPWTTGFPTSSTATCRIRPPSAARPTPASGRSRRSGSAMGGCESGFSYPDPVDPDIVWGTCYSGTVEIYNLRTGLVRSVNPWPDKSLDSPAAPLKYRWNWTPSDRHLAARPQQGLCRQPVRPHDDRRRPALDAHQPGPDDRTTRSKQGSSGGLSKDNLGVEYGCTLFAIAESPVQTGVIWAGSNDGLIHVTRDGGKTWTNVTPAGHAGLGHGQHDRRLALRGGPLLRRRRRPSGERPRSVSLQDRGLRQDLDADRRRHPDARRSATRAPSRRIPSARAFSSPGRPTPSTSPSTTARPGFPSRPTCPRPASPGSRSRSTSTTWCVGTNGRGIWIMDDISPLREYVRRTRPALSPQTPARLPVQAPAGDRQRPGDSGCAARAGRGGRRH